MQKEYLEVGKIVAPHGLKGELKILPWCDTPQFLCQFSHVYTSIDPRNTKFSKKIINSSRVHKSSVIMALKDITDRMQAQGLIGKIIYISKDDVNLEENQYFIQDIIGCSVYDSETQKLYGKITEVFQPGANDVYQITTEDKKNYLIPVIPQVIIDINVGQKRISIKPMKGIFDDEN